MKTMTRMAFVLALLTAGFAAGFSLGDSRGFSRGSEWALVQADIIAREEGSAVTVTFAGNAFHVVQKQPADLYKKAWSLSKRRGKDIMESGERPYASEDALASVYTPLSAALSTIRNAAARGQAALCFLSDGSSPIDRENDRPAVHNNRELFIAFTLDPDQIVGVCAGEHDVPGPARELSAF